MTPQTRAFFEKSVKNTPVFYATYPSVSAGKTTFSDVFLPEEASCLNYATLSGMNYIRHIEKWRNQGYEVILFFLKLPNVEMAINRVKLRVAEGGHNVPENVIRRRYHKGWLNFTTHYKELVDTWVIFDNSGETPIILEESR